jgi:hypothetical protein
MSIRDSSACIVFDYGQKSGRWGFDPQQKKSIFSSSLCVQTGSEVHTASYPMYLI